jgi:hypothetical protein
VKRFLLCLCLSAFTASLIHPFEWERTARREWREFAQAAKSNAADLQSLTSPAEQD